LMGTANIAGAGNALANRLQGNSGNNQGDCISHRSKFVLG